ncbi:MAG TPA: hypothetical protein VNM92_08945 [Thermoanaerobaculia bacterium]|nr:hypothetical protein [Thermoanaerobaculia bacterium]
MRRMLAAALFIVVTAFSQTGWCQSAQEPATQRPGRDGGLPNFNIYLPEGEVSLRIRKLIKNVLFEAQGNYKFVDGDISTFLRYKYYAHTFSYRVSLFDSLEFPDITNSSREFERVRGGLVLFEYPRNYNNRYFVGFQADGLSFGDVTDPDNNKTNVYTKLAYQFGTPFDERMNAIVGESRGRIVPVLTAYRDIGPQRTGLAVALTQTLGIEGDFDYTRFETEALRRLDLTDTSFLVSRAHLGTMRKKRLTGRPLGTPLEESFSVPYNELFKLGGRDAMKGVDDKHRGSEELHLSNEFFFPIFRNRNLRTYLLEWNTLYAIGYAGAGSLGFGAKTFTEVNNFVLDGGLGAEASLTVRDYNILLSLLYAKTFKGPEELQGQEIRFAVRTSR